MGTESTGGPVVKERNATFRYGTDLKHPERHKRLSRWLGGVSQYQQS